MVGFRIVALILATVLCGTNAGDPMQTYRCPSNTVVDTFFVLAPTGGYQSDSWKKVFQFTTDVIKQFRLGPGNARFGVATNRNNFIRLLDLWNIPNATTIERVLKPRLDLNVNNFTTKALGALNVKSMFGTKIKNRAFARQNVVLITDLKLSALKQTLKQAEAIKKKGKKITAIWIGDYFTEDDYKITSPAFNAVLTIYSFDQLAELLNNIVHSLCADPPPSDFPPIAVAENRTSPAVTAEPRVEEVTFLPYPGLTYPTPGPGPRLNCRDGVGADVYFLLDSSKTVGPYNWYRLTEQVTAFASYFPIGPSYYRFGAASFSDNVKKLFDLKDVDGMEALMQKTLQAQFLDGATETGKALEFIGLNDVFGYYSGGRANARDVVILLSDGYASFRQQARLAAERLKSNNVVIITVGIGPDVNVDSLKEIASSPNDFFITFNYDTLGSVTIDVLNRMCSYATQGNITKM
ncbi:collagen alpha-4(VI) chain-like [Physella acuta]|uniref:collagen alpha-4(VI) chain-like n=1 Tax=Physella acuta TaxID=109671 RepID=UPI0027DB1B2E|nr:collagen alpha-4(VI) chain-like [Physella acuta]